MMSHVDGTSTTVDWQLSPTRIAVLPVGSFEQHGARLPLATDTFLAEHCARGLARALGAALLPALPFASSFEHTGFRGSLSLRPETSMAVLRDLAAALSRQNFTRLVVVNGHGGNFHLGPVVRDLNSQDLPIKLLLVSCDRELDTAVPDYRAGELHAGASEISRMLALRPDLVRPPVPDAAAAVPPPGFARADLNTFGIGTRNVSGVWGDASKGDAASGAAMWASIEENLLAQVRERLAWLERDATYAGRGGLAVRPLDPGDVDDGLRLCRLAGWNQTRADWDRFLKLRPEGGFVAVCMGYVVGTVVTLDYAGRLGWIGMMLVDPAHRRRGIGTRLMRAALDSLAPYDAVMLDATTAGKEVYDRLGFVDCLPLDRLLRAASRIPTLCGDGVRPMEEADLAAVAALDAATFGAPRPALIEALHREAPRYAWVATGPKGRLEGFVLGRSGHAFDHLGPLVAPNTEGAVALVRTALGEAGDRPMALDVLRHPGWLAPLRDLGFAVQRSFTRMARGQAPTPESAERLFAIAGPELG